MSLRRKILTEQLTNTKGQRNFSSACVTSMPSRPKQPRTRFRINKPRRTLVFTNSPLISPQSDFFNCGTKMLPIMEFFESCTTQTGTADSQASPSSLLVSKVANSVCVNRLPNNGGSVKYCKRGPRGNNIFAYSW